MDERAREKFRETCRRVESELLGEYLYWECHGEKILPYGRRLPKSEHRDPDFNRMKEMADVAQNPPDPVCNSHVKPIIREWCRLALTRYHESKATLADMNAHRARSALEHQECSQRARANRSEAERFQDKTGNANRLIETDFTEYVERFGHDPAWMQACLVPQKEMRCAVLVKLGKGRESFKKNFAGYLRQAGLNLLLGAGKRNRQ